MAVSTSEFWQQIIRVGIADQETCKSWNDRFATMLAKRAQAAAASGENAKPLTSDSPTLAQFLTANRLLSKYQSQRMIAGRGAELRVGDWIVVDRCEQMPLSRWYQARRVDGKATGVLYPCTDALTSSRWVDREWILPHAAVSHPNLQSIAEITTSALDTWRGAIASILPSGRSLQQWMLDQGPLSPATVAAIGVALAHSVDAMHQAGLVHGDIRPSRIWCGEDRSIVLLRDAGRPPFHPSEESQEHRWFDDDGQSELYAAPELKGDKPLPDTSTDLYSLGAVLYQLVAGERLQRVPMEPAVPSEVMEAVELGPAGDPLLRTLAYAIAPDPEARFPDVASFARALSVVGSAYEQAGIDSQATLQESRHTNAAALGVEAPTAIEVAPSDSSRATPVPSVTPTPVAGPSPNSANATAGSPATAARVSQSAPDATTVKREADKSSSANAGKSTTRGVPVTTVPVPATAQAATDEKQTAAPKSPVPTGDPAGTRNAPKGFSAKVVPAPASTVPTPATHPAALVETGNDQQATSPDAQPPKRAVRRRNRRSRKGPVIIGGVASLLLLGLIGLLMQPGDPPAQDRPSLPLPPPPRPVVDPTLAASNSTTASGVPTSSTRKPAGETTAAGFELIQDDRLLWAPPWPADSSPSPLEMLVPGAQWISSVRLSRVLEDGASNGNTNRWIQWMGPELNPLLAELKKKTGVDPSEIERLTLSAASGTAGDVKSAVTIKLNSPKPLDELTKVWGTTPSRTRSGKTIHSVDDPLADVFFVQPNQDETATSVQSFVYGPPDLISTLAEDDGAAILLPPAIQQIWKSSSDQADLFVLVMPNFLFANAKDWLARFAPRATEPLKSLLVPDAAAATLSMSVVDHWYAEARFAPSGGVTAPAFLQSLQPRVAALPAWAEAFAIESTVDASWKAMAIRLPQFMRVLSDETRFGVSQTMPMANFYLPAEAAPQMTLATMLALATPASEPVLQNVAPEPMQSLTAEQMLDRNMSVSFDQESLEFAVAAIRDEFVRSLPAGVTPPAITIIGGDLEKMGITQNQQIRNFQLRDKPLRDALTELARQANPDKSISTLTDPKQSLVWVVDTTAPADQPTILITTRTAVEGKGLKLPREFTGS